MNRPLLSALALLALACGEPDAAPPPAPDRSAPPSARHGWARVHAPGDATLLRALHEAQLVCTARVQPRERVRVVL